MAQIKITLVKSKFGRIKNQTATIEALGLKKIGTSVVKEDSPAIRGMIDKVSHLVKVEEVK
ncbi:MAG TPA: 50S ribosomal protein L30 [Clostridia bacterium]|jgi:large subunit ribosomal protein L30|nr:50S ribosomal protein L30 [Clostridia bacterium]